MSDVSPLLGSITRSMKHLVARQQVISQNIANGDTPGYKAREMEALDFSSLLTEKGVPHVTPPRVNVTSGMVALGVAPTTDGRIIADANTSETKPNGNNVTLEDQLLKMGEIRTDFTTMTNLYRKQIGLLKTAIGKPDA
jgi:flagellar basal-body rod protein FlgB